MVLGERSAGKTFDAKLWAIDDYLKTGREFVYLRRYKSEVANNKIAKFFDDIQEKGYFANHKFKVKGKELYIDGKCCGVAMALSQSVTERSVPRPFTDKIIFDEFLLKRGNYRYIVDEVTNFLELYETIARIGAKDFNTRVLFVANNVSWSNPYFRFFQVKPFDSQRFKVFGGVVVEYTDCKDLREKKMDTDYYRALAECEGGREYLNYSVHNKVMGLNDDFLAKKPADSRYLRTFIYSGKRVGYWFSPSEGTVYFSWDTNGEGRSITDCAVTTSDNKPRTLVARAIRGQNDIRILRDAYNMGLCFYESRELKDIGCTIAEMFI